MDAAVTFLLDNLKQLVEYNVSLVKGADNELKHLQKELDLLKAELEDASRKNNKEEVFKEWERQIRDTVYEVEDTIDECIMQIAKEKARGVLGKATFMAKRLSLAEKVKQLREETVKPLFTEAGNYYRNLTEENLFHKGVVCQMPDIRKKLPRRDNIVGFQDEIENIVNLLKEDSEQLEVTSIVGMPGLGKTTVAWKIYTDRDLEYEFPTRIWVNVSQEVKKIDILLQILQAFTKQDMSRKSEEELVLEVKKRMENGRILIFLDDVWTPDDWNEIRSFLPMSNGTCKVLLTSRDDKVGWRANPEKGPYNLRFLTFEESWELFQLEVCGKVNVIEGDFARYGKLIANHCDGLPLSIIIIAGILVDKKADARGNSSWLLKEWKKVSESVETSLTRDDKEGHIKKIISLSYTKLPYDLRDCFLYLGIFPEDAEIQAWNLTRIWVAEGFIQEKSGKTLEESAQDNLNDLISRNLLMVAKIKRDGDVKTCRIHDTIREFCKSEAELKERNLFKEIKMSKEKGGFEPPTKSISQYRRLCIHSHVNDLLSERIRVPKARSFLCVAKEDINLERGEIQSLIDSFSLLRVFEAITIKFPIFPSKIMKLHHLRYVTLCVTDPQTILPAAISDLWNLQTLTLDVVVHDLKVEADIWLLMQLRHLKTKASIILCENNRKSKGKGGQNLQTLTLLSTQSCTDDVLEKAKHVTTLGISGDLSELLKSKSFENFTRLEKWKLVNKLDLKVASKNPLRRLPDPSKFPPELRILTLSNTHLDWKHMDVLGQLENLVVLKLKRNAFVGNTWRTAGGGFPALEFLYVERTDLEFWTVTDDGFPKLKNLVLRNCAKLTEVPFCQLNSLEMLYLEHVTQSTVYSAMELDKAKQGVKRGSFKLEIAPEDKPRTS